MIEFCLKKWYFIIMKLRMKKNKVLKLMGEKNIPTFLMLAIKSGLTNVTISRAINKKTTLKTAMAISNVFGVPVFSIFSIVD